LDKSYSFLHAESPSDFHPTNSVKTLKITQSNDPNQWPNLILLVSTLMKYCSLYAGSPVPVLTK